MNEYNFQNITESDFKKMLAEKDEIKICNVISEIYYHIAKLRLRPLEDISFTEIETCRMLVFNVIRRNGFKHSLEQVVSEVRDCFYNWK